MITSLTIENIPANFAESWRDGYVELSPTESLMRFAYTHDVEFMQNQHNLLYTAILTPKKQKKKAKFGGIFGAIKTAFHRSRTDENGSVIASK